LKGRSLTDGPSRKQTKGGSSSIVSKGKGEKEDYGLH